MRRVSHLQDGARLVPWGLVCLGARDRQEVAERVRATDPEPVVDSIALLAAHTRQSDNQP